MDGSKSVPRSLFNIFIRSRSELTTVQIYFWSLVIGLAGGAIATCYGFMLSAVIEFVWKYLPEHLTFVGEDFFPDWLYIMIVPIIMGLFTGLLKTYLPWKTGGIGLMLQNIHSRGYINLEHALPMLLVTLMNIPAGGSAGPEAPVLIILAALVGWVGRQLKQTTRSRRILTLSAMSSGLSAFFGLPLGGALFVLELPHRMGIQYFEAIPPAVVSSLAGVFCAKLISGEEFGPRYDFRKQMGIEGEVKPLNYVDFLVSCLFGVVGAVLAIIFTFYVRQLKKLVAVTRMNKHPVILAVIGGVTVGVIGAFYPSTLFWSEAEMNNILSLNKTKLERFDLTGIFNVETYSQIMCLQIAIAKFVVIGTTIVSGWPGGIIFPLFFAAVAFSQFINYFEISFFQPAVVTIALMSSVECAITRTALSTSVISVLLHKESDNPNRAVGMFPLTVASSFIALFLTRKYHFFSSSCQHSRRDVHFFPIKEDAVKDGQDDEAFGKTHFQYNHAWNHVEKHREYLNEMSSKRAASFASYDDSFRSARDPLDSTGVGGVPGESYSTWLRQSEEDDLIASLGAPSTINESQLSSIHERQRELSNASLSTSSSTAAMAASSEHLPTGLAAASLPSLRSDDAEDYELEVYGPDSTTSYDRI